MAAVPQVVTPNPSVRSVYFGISGSGRTHAALASISPKHKKVLYIGMARNALVDQKTNPLGKGVKVDTIIVSSWADFEKQVLAPARKGELKYDAIVVDDYNTGIEYLSSPSGQNSQQEWGIITARMVSSITLLASAIDGVEGGQLIVTLAVVDDPDDGTRKIALNPATASRLMDKFNYKNYTHASKDKDGLKFGIQSETVLALRFMA